VVVVLSVGLLETNGQVSKVVLGALWQQTLPVTLVGQVHHGEEQTVSFGRLLQQGAVEGIGEEVLVERSQGIQLLTLSHEGGEVTLRAVKRHLLGIPQFEVIYLQLVPLAEVDRDGLGESPRVNHLLLGEFLDLSLSLVYCRGISFEISLLTCRDAVGYLQIVILDDELAPGEVIVGMTHIDYLPELLPDMLDNVQHLLLVSLEVPLVLVRVDQILLHSAQSQFVVVGQQFEHEGKSQ